MPAVNKMSKTVLLMLISILAGVSKGSAADSNTVYALHFVLRDIDYSEAYDLVKYGSELGYNTLVVDIRNTVSFTEEHCPDCKSSWSDEEVRKFVNNVRALDMEIIPEIKLLTHQEVFFKGHFSDLMYNKHTYNPADERVYSVVFDYLDKVIEVFSPSAIHIGHDEVAGHSQKSSDKTGVTNANMLPASLYLQDVVKLNNYISSKDIDVWMWGDMLISPEEFPNMFDKHLHGTTPGYGKELRDKIPKNITICDWHYFGRREEYPSTKAFRDEGFPVLASTWSEENTTARFSSYANEIQVNGFIATTWWHVQKKDWPQVQKILRQSIEAYQSEG